MRSRTSLRPRLEWLEDRAVPAAYVVATNGSDANPGTSAAPWRTLQHAADAVRAGDSVTVRPGDYTGFYLDTSGTSAAPIVFTGESGARVTTRNATTPDGINLEGASWITIQGFTVINQPRAGIRSVVNDHVTIRNNACDSNGRWGILTGFSDDLLIENNICSRSVAEHGIYVSNSGDRPVVRGNTLWGNAACGLHMNGDLSAGGDGIISNALVENNVIYSNGAPNGGSSINGDGVRNSVIRNNLIYDARASGISLYCIDGGGGSTGNQVLNNTVLVASTGRWALNIQDGSTNNTARNNVLFSAHSSRGAIDISSDSLSGFVSDYNVVEGLFTTTGGGALTLAQWRSQTGQDANSAATTDPSTLFVNAAGGDYHLRSGSAAIDRGTTTGAPTVDYEGTPRPSGAGVDVGHDELATSPPPPNSPPTISDVANQTVPANGNSGPLAFTVSDGETAAGSLQVAATSSNPTLIPAGGLVLGGSGGSRTITVTPTAGRTGTATITLTVTDAGGLTDTDTFLVTVPNTAPTISDVTDRTIPANGTSGAIAFTISDAETSAGSLQVTASSSNTTLVPASGLVLGGSGGNRTITVNPAAGQIGTATITLTVTDLAGLTDTDTFLVTVPNSPPTISDVADRTIAQDTSTGAISFTVSDLQTAAGSLQVTASSNNTTLVPASGLSLGGSGGNRTITVTPAAGQTGIATITLTVTDAGGLTATDTFLLTVTPPQPGNTPPTISDVADRTVQANSNSGAIAFTISDAETAAGSLVVTASSNHTTLVPASGLVLGGSGGNRTITVTPATGRTGTATITLTVTDAGGLTDTDTFLVTVPNTAPNISDVTDRTIPANGTSGAIAFTISDAETSAGSLQVTASSSNTTLIPASGLVLGGSGGNRTITVNPAAGQIGTATITLTVTDLAGLTDTDTFVVTVPNSPPTISDVADRTIQSGQTTPAIPFTVGDAQTAAGSLSVTASSSNTALLPSGGIQFGGSGANRTVTLTPAAGQTGTVTVTLIVTDAGGLTDTDTFVLTVTSPPVIPPPPPPPPPPPADDLGDPLAVGGSADGGLRVYAAGTDDRYGTTPTTLRPFGSVAANVRTASADVNGDGVLDVVAITGPGTPIRVAVLNGVDHGVLVAPFDPFGGDFGGGGFVTAGDFDRDGRAEFVVTPDQGGGPRVSIFSLTGGQAALRANFLTIEANFRGGARPGAGDINGDGVPDLVVSAGFLGGPRIVVLDGTKVLSVADFTSDSDKLVSDFFAFSPELRNGAYVTVGDVNGDGFGDLVFGAGPGGGPEVRIASGQTLLTAGSTAALSGAIADFFLAGDLNNRGGVRVAVKDVDGDNRVDVVAGTGGNQASFARVYFGKHFGAGGEPGGFQDLDPFAGAVLADGVYVG